MRLGISSYTFIWAAGVPGYEPPRKKLTHAELLQKASDLRVQVVQIADNMPLDLLSAREIDQLAGGAQERGLSLEMGACGFERKHLERYLGLSVRVHSPLLRVVLDTPGVHVTTDEAVSVLKQVLPEFQRQNVCLAIENH